LVRLRVTQPFQLDGANAGNPIHEDDEAEPDFYAHGMGG
jgi:hypothetical protein